MSDARSYDDLIRQIAVGTITRARACDGKRAYRTPDYADAKAREFTARFGTPQRPYFCPFCEQYHLASTTEAA